MRVDHRSGFFRRAPFFLEVLMGLVNLTRRVGQDAAVAVTGGAAALSGAATGAAAGAVNGATQGASHARGSGPRSPALAALVVAAIGVTGLIEWPVLALGSVAALVLGQRRNKPASTPISPNAAPAASAGPSTSTASTASIRDWARTNGHPVSPRGRLGADIVAAFNAAH